MSNNENLNNSNVPLENENNNEICEIENKRVAFISKYKSNQKRQLIISIIFVVIVLAGMFILLNYPSYLIFTFLGIIICFVGLSAYAKTCAREKEKNVKAFVEDYRKFEIAYLYNQDFSAFSNDSYKSIDPEEIRDLNLFSSAEVVESNNYINARYLSKEFKSYSLAIYKDKTNLSFIGKYYALRLEKEINGRLIINISKDNALEIKLEGLSKIEANYDIYTSLSEEDLNNVLKEEVKNIIDSFVIDDNTLAICILIENNYLKAFIKYTNKFVDIPVETEIDENVLKTNKENLSRILEIYKNI